MYSSASQVGYDTWRVQSNAGDSLVYRPVARERIPLFQHLQSLNAPILPKIEFVGQDNTGGWCVVEEWIRGITVAEMIPLVQGDIHKQFLLAKLLAGSLFVLHQGVGIVHGDIKPTNIVLVPDEKRCVFVDLEFAVMLGERQTARSLGYTPLYVSWEQQSGSRVERASDIRALGLTLIEVLLGRHPFLVSVENIPLSDVAYRVATTEFRSHHDEPLWNLLGWMTAARASDRPRWPEIRRAIGF